MKVFKLAKMSRGWFVGDFVPTALRTQTAEVAVKSYVAGAVEGRHMHKIASEITLILSGRARLNEESFEAGDIVVLDPGDATDFEALTDVTTVVVKLPSVAGDKYEC